MINGRQVLTFDDFLSLVGPKKVSIAIADSTVRRAIHSSLACHNIDLFDVASENLVVYDCVNVGPGSILASGCILTSNITIGTCFQANINSYVAHDCHIGDYVTFAPAVKCNGNVVIEDGAYIGTGAIIKQGNQVVLLLSEQVLRLMLVPM